MKLVSNSFLYNIYIIAKITILKYKMNYANIFYKLYNLSSYTKTIEQGNLIDEQIISNTFYIPYCYCQDAYSDCDVNFMVELFYNNMKIFECEIHFELFEDNNDETILKNLQWKPVYIHDVYIENYFENIECRDCYILGGKLFIIFDIDLKINGYKYEQIYGVDSYDWENDLPQK